MVPDDVEWKEAAFAGANERRGTRSVFRFALCLCSFFLTTITSHAITSPHQESPSQEHFKRQQSPGSGQG